MSGLVGEWLDIAYKVITGLFAVWFYFDRKNDKTNQRISALEDTLDRRLDGITDRITRVEVDLENAPSHNDLGKIYDEIRKQSDSMSSMNANLAAQSSSLKQLNEWLSRVDSYLRSNK